MMIDRRRSVGTPPRCAGYVPAWLRERTGVDDSAILQAVDGCRVIGDGVCEVAAPGFVLDRTRFDKNLAIHAMEAGADLAQALILRRHEGQVVGRRNGLEAAFGARVILGADGPASVIGRSVGLANRQLMATLQYEVGLRTTDVWLEYQRQEGIPGIAWFVPCGRTARVGIAVRRGQARFLKTRLNTFVEQLVADGRVFSGILGCTGGLLPLNGPLETAQFDGVVLAGDAAGLAEPFSGAGIAAAVVSGELAGSLIGQALRSDRLNMLDDYDLELRVRLPNNGASMLSERMAQVAVWRPPEL